MGATPVVLDAAIVLVEDEYGNPVLVGSEFGPPGTFVVSHFQEREFHRILRGLGLDRTLIVDRVELPAPPPEAKLIRGPR